MSTLRFLFDGTTIVIESKSYYRCTSLAKADRTPLHVGLPFAWGYAKGDCFSLVAWDSSLDVHSDMNEQTNEWTRERLNTQWLGNCATVFRGISKGERSLDSKGVYLLSVPEVTPWNLNTNWSNLIRQIFYPVYVGVVSQGPNPSLP
jgi:hypothetical protein